MALKRNCPLIPILLVAIPALAGSPGDTLPAPVRSTLDRHFPAAVVEGYGMESENGVPYYEVRLLTDGNEVEVEVAADGSVGESESVVDLERLPTDHQERIRDAVGRGQVRAVEKHARVGIAKGGTFVPVSSPAAFYDVTYRLGGRNRSVQLAIDPRQAWVLDGEDDDDPDSED